jgi:hypothetical protein
MIANSKPNKKYKPGYLRIVVDSAGIQRVALPNSACIRRITDTEVRQTTKLALIGMCEAVFVVVNPDDDYSLFKGVKLISQGKGTNEDDTFVTYHATAYLDTTEQHADPA